MMNLSRKLVYTFRNVCCTRSFHNNFTICQKKGSYFDDPGFPRVALSKDKRTILMYHPIEEVNYEDTIPIPRSDARYSDHESADDVLKLKLKSSGFADRIVEQSDRNNILPLVNKERLPAVMELSGLFYTSKYKWMQHRNVKMAKEKLVATKKEKDI